MKLNKLIALLLSVFCVFGSIDVVSYAENVFYYDYGVSSMYVTYNEQKSELYLSGTTATCNSKVTGEDLSKISIKQTLQKQGIFWVWSDVDGASWTKTSYASVLSMTNTKTGLSSGKYRLKSVFTLTDSNGEIETITVYSDDVKVS